MVPVRAALEQLCTLANFILPLILKLSSEHTKTHRPAETLSLFTQIYTDLTEVHSGNNLLRVPEGIITAEKETVAAHFNDGFTAVEVQSY